MEYNKTHGIIPKNVVRSIKEKDKKEEIDIKNIGKIPKDELDILINDLENDMKDAAAQLDFETAAKIRDKILTLKGVSE